MLQVVLGLDAAAIAAAFLTPAATVGQRLSRAKTKIRDTRIAFEVPPPSELPARLSAVLEAIYAAYNHGWDETQGADARRSGLTEEAIWLARMVALLLPDQPEALGLLALMQYCEARRPARRTAEGAYVPMSAQDTRLWSAPRLEEADQLLRRAATHARHGRFQLEAAIQSAHVERVRSAGADWSVIALLYEGLVQLAPTFGALLGRAAAVAQARGPEAGLALLSQLPENQMEAHQPYWALRAHLLRELGRSAAADAAFTKAIELTEDEAVRRFLERAAMVRGN
jgi:RNA polymerase sigma-70 factor (ECF subfamily)